MMRISVALLSLFCSVTADIRFDFNRNDRHAIAGLDQAGEMARGENPIHFGAIGDRLDTGAVGRPNLGDDIAPRELVAEIEADFEESIMLAERKAIPGRH